MNLKVTCPRCGATTYRDEQLMSEGKELRCANRQCLAIIDAGEPVKPNPRGIGATEAEFELQRQNQKGKSCES